MEYETIVRN